MKTKIKLFLTYLPRIQPYLGLLAIAFVSDIALSLISMLPPLFSVAIFDYAYPNRDLFIFNLFIVAGLLIYFIDVFLSASIDYINLYVDRQLECNMSHELFTKIEHLPVKFHTRAKIGDLTIRLTDDIYLLTDLITGLIPVFLVNLAKLGFFLYIAFRMDFRITILALCSVPLYLIETKFFSDKLEDIQVETQKAEGKILDSVQERLLNIRTIKAFSQEDKEASFFRNRVLARFKIGLKERLVSIISAFTNSVTLKVWGVFIAWYLGYEVISGYLSIGELVALTMYLGMLSEPISELSGLYSSFKTSMVSVERVDKIFSLRAEVVEKEKGVELIEPEGVIKFDDLSFGYEPKYKVLSNIKINIPENSSVAIVGASGSGKTTLINLLMRFYPIKEGAIYIDGKNISEIKLDSLRKTLGAVFQEVSLFEGTIRDNISYGSKHKTEEDIINAAKAAQAHDFISRLPGGYKFWIRTQGVNLSGGQRQRIALARVFLYDPKIIIMDEATSAIDPESEFLIQETIYRCMGTKTLFIVAHRLSTIKKVDKIIVLDEGRIVEEGAFDELLKKKGLFFKLYNFQFGGFEVFKEHLDIEFQRYIRYKEDLSLIIMEVDNFEKLTKKYPFEKLLNFMNELNLYVRRNLRVMDFSTTFHEKQILIGLPETDTESAKIFCERVNKLLEKERIKIDGEGISTSLTTGIVSCKEIKAQYGEDLFEMATEALKTAKRNGLKIGVFQ